MEVYNRDGMNKGEETVEEGKGREREGGGVLQGTRGKKWRKNKRNNRE